MYETVAQYLDLPMISGTVIRSKDWPNDVLLDWTESPIKHGSLWTKHNFIREVTIYRYAQCSRNSPLPQLMIDTLHILLYNRMTDHVKLLI